MVLVRAKFARAKSRLGITGQCAKYLRQVSIITVDQTYSLCHMPGVLPKWQVVEEVHVAKIECGGD